MKRYLHLKFKNAGLIYVPGPKGNVHVVRNIENVGDSANVRSHGHDLINPLPYTLLGNILRVLSGEIPVPTHRVCPLEREPIYDEIAMNSYIRYDEPVKFDDKGFPINVCYFQGQKSQWNCGIKYPIRTIDIYGGKTKEVQGDYTWYRLKIDCMGKNAGNKYSELINFISSLVGYRATTKNVEEVVYDLSKSWEDEEFINKVNAFIKEHTVGSKCMYKNGWISLFFNVGKMSCNVSVSSNRGVAIQHEILGKIKLSGEIICPIENDEIAERILNGPGFATILEGGILHFKDMSIIPPYPYFEDEFEKIH